MAVNEGMFSSKSDEWETPQDLFDRLDAEFHFNLDPCATVEMAKCAKFYTKEQDGLAHSWVGDRAFVNPPYGREIGRWLRKANYESKAHGVLVVMLVPARTDTQWWHNYVMEASEIRFIKGRIRFVGAEHSAPFPSVVVVFDGRFMGKPIVKSMEA